MIPRFQIEDLVAQDATGVVFRAIDSETGAEVALRRFFPHGPDGGGLSEAEQSAFAIAIERLSTLSHPALRSVIRGGCDPVDAMPFIATEWVEGDSLDEVLGDSPMPPEAAALLISQALEVSELLSQVFAEEAVWVETDFHTVVVSRSDAGRGFTFWVSPFKWLGVDGNRDLRSVIPMVETAMGWANQTVRDQAGRGLGGWLRWLRQHADTASLREARETLAASLGSEPPVSAPRLVSRAIVAPRRVAVPPMNRKSSGFPAGRWLAALAMLIAAGSVGWLLYDQARQGRLQLPGIASAGKPVAPASASTPPPAGEVPPAAETAPLSSAPSSAKPVLSEAERVARANERAAAISKRLEPAAAKKEPAMPSGAPSIIPWNETEKINSHGGSEITIRGKVWGVEKSNTGKTVYLLFAGTSNKRALRVGIECNPEDADAVKSRLERFKQKEILATGMVKKAKYTDQRPEMIFTDMNAAIREAP